MGHSWKDEQALSAVFSDDTAIVYKEGMDVSAIAKRYGGGRHKKAAGFSQDSLSILGL